MEHYILVINAGSSSIKYKVYTSALKELASGLCERIGVDGNFKINFLVDNQLQKFEEKTPFPDYDTAIDTFLKKLMDLQLIKDLNQIKGIGHRIAHGAEMNRSCIIDDNVVAHMEKCIRLAPLHNKPELDIIKIFMKKLPHIKNVAVFDTSFHTSIPKINSAYALPQDLVKKLDLKRYGFHGTSYRYITEKMATILKNKTPNLIICHLGNGSSICCVKNGKSLDTSVGTPISGLIMGTRCGDIDASIIQYIHHVENLSLEAIFNAFNKQSGLKGICGSSDFRDIEAHIEKGNDYEFARDLYVQKIVNYIAIYRNYLNNQVDALVFTGGIGENAKNVRSLVCQKSQIRLNQTWNDQDYDDYQLISDFGVRPKVYAVRTNEELKIAQDTNDLTS